MRSVHLAPKYPDPIPDWMKVCNYAWFAPGLVEPITSAGWNKDSNSGELRVQWWPKEGEDGFTAPVGPYVAQWLTDNDDFEFIGEFENKRTVTSNGKAAKGTIWVRYFDENGFFWDGVQLPVEAS